MPLSLGDRDVNSMVDFKFTTTDSTGVPTALAGTPVVSVYAVNDVAQSTSGITLTVDFDTVTGLNHVRIDTSANGVFYATGNDFIAVITTGTVGGVSVVGYVLAHFSIGKSSALRPTTAARTLDVSAAGEAGVDWANVGSPTTTVGLSGTTIKDVTDVNTKATDIQARVPAALVSGRMDAQLGGVTAGVDLSATMKTSINTEVDSALDTAVPASPTANSVNDILKRQSLISVKGSVNDTTPLVGDFNGDAGLSATNDFYNGMILAFKTGVNAGITRQISDYVGATKNFQFTGAAGEPDAPWTTVPADTDTFEILGRMG